MSSETQEHDVPRCVAPRHVPELLESGYFCTRRSKPRITAARSESGISAQSEMPGFLALPNRIPCCARREKSIKAARENTCLLGNNGPNGQRGQHSSSARSVAGTQFPLLLAGIL